MESFSSCMERACASVKKSVSKAKSYMLNALRYKDGALDAERKAELAQRRAENARDIAVMKASEVGGYVIPTDATYAKDELDDRFATIALGIWEATAIANNTRLKDFN